MVNERRRRKRVENEENEVTEKRELEERGIENKKMAYKGESKCIERERGREQRRKSRI